jgi:hypothetical protein
MMVQEVKKKPPPSGSLDTPASFASRRLPGHRGGATTEGEKKQRHNGGGTFGTNQAAA